VGVEVLAGKIRPRVRLLTEDGKDLGEILQIQDKGEAISSAETGMQVAVSIDKPVVGRHFDERDILYVSVPESHAKKLLSEFQERLDRGDIQVLSELVEMMRKITPFWAA